MPPPFHFPCTCVSESLGGVIFGAEFRPMMESYARFWPRLVLHGREKPLIDEFPRRDNIFVVFDVNSCCDTLCE